MKLAVASEAQRLERQRSTLAHSKFRERAYIWCMILAWATIPGVRRVVDWLDGYNSFPIINLLPMIIMVPLFWHVLRVRKYSRNMMTVIGLWAAAFGYALFVAVVSGGAFSAIYDLALFTIPALGGLWIANAKLSAQEAFETLTTACLTVGTLTSIYGLFQFVSPPAWDINWVINSNIITMGTPTPFGLRIFSTMNHPSVFSIFLVFTLLISLHRFSRRKWWIAIPLIVCSMALAFTLVRAAWIALFAGLVIYGLCCSQRKQFGTFCATMVVLIVITTGVLSFVPTGEGSVADRLVARAGSFGDIQTDDSAVDREQQSKVALRESLAEPLGQGLGTVGTSTKLASADATTVVDNGYLSRFLELGFIGLAAYLAAILSALVLTLKRWSQARKMGLNADVDLLCAAMAIQAALICGELAGDVHNSFPGVFFWFSVALALRGKPYIVSRQSLPNLRPRFASSTRSD